MKVRAVIATASAVALISGGGALALAFPAAAASGSASHTLRFISERVNEVPFSKTAEGIQDKDITGKHRVIGFDQLNLVFNPATGTGTAGLTIDIDGGILIGYINVSSSPTFKGYITAGIGDFKGAFGTITGKLLNKAGTKAAVTITYSV
jgi:hypothetical protein